MQFASRRFAIALASTAGILALIGAAVGPTPNERGEAPFGVRDVLTSAVTAAELSAFLAAEDSRAGFRAMGSPVMLSAANSAGVQVTMAYSPERPLADSATAAEGVVLYRLDADAEYGPLAAGANYLWMDGRGLATNPWRGIMISADGSRRTLMSSFKYTPATEHNSFSPLDHARQYCEGLQGCIYLRTGVSLEETVWVRCTQGCCEMQLSTPAPKPRPRP